VTAIVDFSTSATVSNALTIAADPTRLVDVRRFAERAARACGLPAEEAYQVKLALSEAVANAIEHGSARRDDRIEMSVASEDDALVFTVTDTGTFVNRSARSPNAERGRGLGFIELLMDELEIEPTPSGTTVRFAKRLAV
jgi:anti-sigma regulatory factor (Ser/Thr protein kinase)